MSGASDRLARTRLALIEQAHLRESRHERGGSERARAQASGDAERDADDAGSRGGAGWFGGIKRFASSWWRSHPAHLGLELATPLLSSYARKKPLQFLGIAALVGAGVVVARPWRLVSATGVLVALMKSSQLSSLLMSAMSSASFGSDSAEHE